MLVRISSGAFSLVGYSGLDGATAGALDTLAHRLPASCFLSPAQGSDAAEGTSLSAQDNASLIMPDSRLIDLDLTQWYTPGDDLERLGASHPARARRVAAG